MSDLKNQLQQLTEQESLVMSEMEDQMDAIMSMLSSVRAKADVQKLNLEEEEAQKKKERTREAEEYAYEFEKRKKRQEEELRDSKMKAESELAEKREALKVQEDELSELRGLAKTFESRLAKGVADAVEKATKEQKMQFDHEKTLMISQTKATQALLEQKITLLEKTIADQDKEVDRLNVSSRSAIDQMTRIAERAVTKISEPQVNPSASSAQMKLS